MLMASSIATNMSMACPVQLQHIYGYNTNVRHNLVYVNECEILYVCGSVIVIYNTDKKTQRFIYTTVQSSSTAHSAASLSTQSQQSSSTDIQCIAVGTVKPAGTNTKTQIVAVSERGNIHRSARVSIYDLNTGKRRVKFPVCNSTQQSHDILDVQFSGDGRYVLIQGGAPDYMLSQIAWDKNKLVCSGSVGLQTGVVSHTSYCTIDPTVIAVCGNNILRFLHIENGEFKVIPYSGNTSIGSSVTHYTCHLWISSMYILCSISGEISVYDNAEYKGIVQSSKHTALSIYAIIPTSKGFIVAGSNSKVCVYEYDTQQCSTSNNNNTTTPQSYNNIFKLVRTIELDDKHQTILNIALNSSEDVLLCSTDNRQMYSVHIASNDTNMIGNNTDNNTTSIITSLNTSYHSDSIVGSATCVNKPLVATICHADRTVCIWNYINHTMDLLVHLSDKPDCIAFHPNGLHCIIGSTDTVQIYDILIDTVKSIYIHSIKQCTSAVYSHCGSMYLLSYGNTIGLYNTYTNHCIHTYNIHHTDITYIEFSLDDHMFVSSSSDNTVLYTSIYNHNTQTIMKPKIDLLSHCIVDNVVYASTISNKLLLSNEFNTSAAHTNCVEINTDTTSNTSLCTLATLHGKSTGILLAGNSTGHVILHTLPISTTCNSSTLYTHNGAVRCIGVSADNQHMFSVGTDGVLCIYSINSNDLISTVKHKVPLPSSVEQSELNDNVLIERVALQDKLQLLTQLEHDISDLYAHNEINIKRCEGETRDQLRVVTEQHTAHVHQLHQQQHDVQQTMELVNQKYQAKIVQLTEVQQNKLQELKLHCEQKLSAEFDRYRALQDKLHELELHWCSEYEKLEQELTTHKECIAHEYQHKIQQATQHTVELGTARQQMQQQLESDQALIESYVELELGELQQSYESKLSNERLITLRLRDQNSVLKRKFESLKQEIQHNLDELSACKQNEQSLYSRINALNYEIECVQKEIQERNNTIREKQDRVQELKKKNQELEKFKFVLDYKITELKKQIEPRTMELSDLTVQLNTITTQCQQKAQEIKLSQFHTNQLQLKSTAAQHQYQELQHDVESTAEIYHAVAQQIYELIHTQHANKHKQYKDKIVELYQQCVQRKIELHTLQPKSTVEQYERELQHLQRSLQSMQVSKQSNIKSYTNNKSMQRLQAEHNTLQSQLQQSMQQLSNDIERRINRHHQSMPVKSTSKLQQQVDTNQQQIERLKQLIANHKFTEKTHALVSNDEKQNT